MIACCSSLWNLQRCVHVWHWLLRSVQMHCCVELWEGNTTEDAAESAMDVHTDNPLLLSLMISKKVSWKKMTPAGWRQQVSKHAHRCTLVSYTHTNHTVYRTLLSSVRVMILLYLHGFSYIDLDQEEAPPAGAPFLGSPPGSYCACVWVCAKYQQLVCQQRVCVLCL